MTTADLIEKYYGCDVPYHGRTIISGLVRSLVAKTKLLNDNCRVFASERAGPKPIEVWVKKRKGAA